MAAVDLVEVWRSDLLESVHRGHAVICNGRGEVVESWGDPQAIVYPRSSSKMIQALPLVESGAADLHRLTPEHLALACASHQGAGMVQRIWLYMTMRATPGSNVEHVPLLVGPGG